MTTFGRCYDYIRIAVICTLRVFYPVPHVTVITGYTISDLNKTGHLGYHRACVQVSIEVGSTLFYSRSRFKGVGGSKV